MSVATEYVVSKFSEIRNSYNFTLLKGSTAIKQQFIDQVLISPFVSSLVVINI